MGTIRWLVTLSALPFVWGQFDARYPPARQNIIKKTDNVLAPLFRLRQDPDGVSAASPSPVSSVATRTPLECFQVAEPVLTEAGLTLRGASQPYVDETVEAAATPSCSQVLMVHSFANSYGAPFVGNYTPPDCDFDRVVINFTTLVAGRQYDRTGVMYLGDTEVWRTSTAEPTPTGIRWVWLKDMTPFVSLWKKPQTLIFDLENIVNEQYTGILNTTLTATFFKSDAETGSHPPADLIIPITQRLGSTGKPSQFTVPEQSATNTVSFPRNANRAVFSVDVKGQGNEEFWWSNVPQSATLAFGGYPGYSPWREVQVVLDGQLVGVVWPFPVIYTGGVVPQLHRPIVGIDAFDLREHEVDITPWLPLLCDGSEHTFSIRITGLDDNGVSEATPSNTTDSSWYVTGKIFVWLDDEDSVTTGTIDAISQAPPAIDFSQTITQDDSGANKTLEYRLGVSREFSVSSYVKTQRHEGTVTWTQGLSYSNIGGLYDYGNGGINTFSISGADQADGQGISFSTQYRYPLYCNQSMDTTGGSLSLWAVLDQGLDLVVSGSCVFPTGLETFGGQYDGSALSTWRNGTAEYYRPANNSYSSGVGQTEQVFSFGGKPQSNGNHATITPLYFRHVSAFNDSVTMDSEEVMGKAVDHK